MIPRGMAFGPWVTGSHAATRLVIDIDTESLLELVDAAAGNARPGGGGRRSI